jgi:hypothetical protein
MKRFGAQAGLLLAAAVLAGCSGFGSTPKVAVVDPNTFPSNYRHEVAILLRTTLTERSEFVGALISAPALKPVPGGQTPHYVTCLQLNSAGERKIKAVVFLEGHPSEFIDAIPEQCGDAAYQPFGELQGAMPSE